MQRSLVAFDTDHIKSYVFGTDRLKEIRGASSLLDRLNRYEMVEIALRDYDIEKEEIIYVNGGSGLFLIDENRAEEFGKRIQRMYREKSDGRATTTVAWQELPTSLAAMPVAELKKRNLKHELELLTYQLVEKKGIPLSTFTLSSHPFMRPCSSCGVEYAETKEPDERNRDAFHCSVCVGKQDEDGKVKRSIAKRIDFLLTSDERGKEKYLWDRILWYLKQEGYDLRKPGINRPEDFNIFRQFTVAKEYIGLIYADANNMGKMVEKLHVLEDREAFAKGVDEAIHKAIAYAIAQLLPGVEIAGEDEQNEKRKKGKIWVFPFDILLVGGDDAVLATDAAKAMDVALIIAQQFRKLANDKQTFADNKRIAQLLEKEAMSLSVGVVMAPIKYPFGLLQDMAESALKFAKKAAADDKAEAGNPKQFDGTRINFQVVTGGSHPNFNETYKEAYQKVDKKLEFHASLRAYKPEDLEILLNTIREGHKLNLGRTKLHQLREAILDKNLTTSVQKGLATLRNWRDKQRAHVVGQVYEFGGRYQMPRSDPRDPISGFPRVTFPWFADGKHKDRSVYRTPLLDFVELYDFVTREGGSNGDEV